MSFKTFIPSNGDPKFQIPNSRFQRVFFQLEIRAQRIGVHSQDYAIPHEKVSDGMGIAELSYLTFK